jgi:hypothetical protein
LKQLWNRIEMVNILNSNDLVHISFLESDTEFIFYRGHFSTLPQEWLPRLKTVYCLQNQLDQLYDYVLKILQFSFS